MPRNWSTDVACATGRPLIARDSNVPLAALRNEFHGPLIVANGFTRATATQALAEDLADAVAFGRLFIANPDLPERFRLDAPLNALEEEKLYGGSEEGYTDYPAMGPQLVDR